MSRSTNHNYQVYLCAGKTDIPADKQNTGTAGKCYAVYNSRYMIMLIFVLFVFFILCVFGFVTYYVIPNRS